MKKLSAIMIGLILLACGSGNSASEFYFKAVSVTDSLSVGDSHASVIIEGEYPVGTSVLADSVRMWIGAQMATTASYSGRKLFDATPDIVADGEKLARTCCDSLLSGADRDFWSFAEDGFSVNYEYDVRFGVSYMGEHLLTCNFSAYGYEGGAHGGVAAMCASFDKNSGEILTYDKVFEPEKRGELIDMIKSALWTQYFEEGNGDGTLADALLVKPDEVRLPVALPEFTEEGIIFSYQQYEIACYAAGMPSCVLTYRQLKPLMRPGILELLP